MQKENSIMVPFNNPLIRFIAEPRYRWLRHTLFIILCLILGFKGDVGAINDHRPYEVRRAFLLMDIWTTLGIMSAIYFLILVLIPKLLFGSRVFAFAISFFVLLSLIYFLVWWVDIRFLGPLETTEKPRFQHVELSFLAYIQYCAISAVLLGSVVGLAIFKKWINDLKKMNELYQANVRTELEQLKSQVNPHFLFNTLNNLLVLTKTDPEKASQVILGLSDLLRYQLYDTTKDTILLSKDIDFMRNLLALEKIRKNDFEYSISTKGAVDGVGLPPFLFIPFVENAVKHGASSVGHSYLNIRFEKSNGQLQFFSENSIPPVQKKTVGGLGLANVKRRLELLYPGKHSLQIIEGSDLYSVHLTIPV